MRIFIFTSILVFSITVNAFCFDASTYFSSKPTWTKNLTSLTTVYDLYSNRFYTFIDDMKASDLFGFTNQMANAVAVSNSNSKFTFTTPTFGTRSVDFADWPPDIFNTSKGIFLCMASLMFVRIVFKGGVA